MKTLSKWCFHALLLCSFMRQTVSYCSGGYAQTCTSGYTYYTGDSYEYCYMAVSSTVNWYGAKSGCESSGGWLVTIHSAAENSLVDGLYGGNKWIGFNDIASEGTWVWLYGTSSYSNWASGEPNNLNDEDCTEQYSGGSWNDLRCSAEYKYGYVCQILPTCSICSPNTYSNAGDSTCTNCPSGKFSSSGSSSCSYYPTAIPTAIPTAKPTFIPTAIPTAIPTTIPTITPTMKPSPKPTGQPTSQPSRQPTRQPSTQPTARPSLNPTSHPSGQPTSQPSSQPTRQPSTQPTAKPSLNPTSRPSGQPTSLPTCPTSQPSTQPTSLPTGRPTRQPTCQPTSKPTSQPTTQPTTRPSSQPSNQPTGQPSSEPTSQPSSQPTSRPSRIPSSQPSSQPTSQPSALPSSQPSSQPSCEPSCQPSSQPSSRPSSQPTSQPSSQPTVEPSSQPSSKPSSHPTQPTSLPTSQPTSSPTTKPTQPSSSPSSSPTAMPSLYPTNKQISVNSFSLDSKLGGSFTFLDLVILLLVLFCGLSASAYYYFIYRFKKRKDGTAETRWNVWKATQHDKENMNKAINAIDFNDVFGSFETHNPLPQVVNKVEKKKNKYVSKDDTLYEASNPLHRVNSDAKAVNQAAPDDVVISVELPVLEKQNAVVNTVNPASSEPRDLPTVNPMLYNSMVKKNPLKKNHTTRQVYEVSGSVSAATIEEIVKDIDL